MSTDPNSNPLSDGDKYMSDDLPEKQEFCSACGSNVPHHIAYVREKGKCVV